MCADPSEGTDAQAEVRRLLAFLEPVMSLQTAQERFEKYQETWTKMNPTATTTWSSDVGVNFPWDASKVEFWKTLRGDIQSRFRTVICDEFSSERTGRSIRDFSFMDYSAMLLWLLDTFLAGLDDYIHIQDRIAEVSENMHEYPEDERHMLEKSMCRSRVRRAQDFLDVILFMHAVPQRVADRWDALDHESDVMWFREHCEVYLRKEELMAFLRDCAVMLLITGWFAISPEVTSIHDCYMQFANRVASHEVETVVLASAPG